MKPLKRLGGECIHDPGLKAGVNEMSFSTP
jgi:hypothetical protein